MARTRLYRDGKLELEGFPPADWLDLLDPDRDRPKLDRYPTHLFLTAHAARLDNDSGELATSEISAFITSRALITVRGDDGVDIGAATCTWRAMT